MLLAKAKTEGVGEQVCDRVEADAGRSVASGFSDDLKRYFRENCPILLDGAIATVSPREQFVREAKETLARVGSGQRLPASILRETLAAVDAEPRPVTTAGMTAVGPRRVRVWWDDSLIGDTDDVLASLDRPRLVLRFYDVTGMDPDAGRWNNLFDVDADMADRGKTVDFWSPDRVYVVELGYLHADGRFLRLARTNTAEIPRECMGNRHPGEKARSSLRRQPEDAAIRPDVRTLAWAEKGLDQPERDIDAEMVVHMLYRAFLAEGPRALRKAPRLVRRDPDVLRREYEQRSRRRDRQAAVGMPPPARPAIIAARLDSWRGSAAPATPVVSHLPVLASPLARLKAERFDAHHCAVDAARSGCVARPAQVFTVGKNETLMLPPPAEQMSQSVHSDAISAARAADGLVVPMPETMTLHRGISDAAPVFEAARLLREQLSRLPDAVHAATDIPVGKFTRPRWTARPRRGGRLASGPLIESVDAAIAGGMYS